MTQSTTPESKDQLNLDDALPPASARPPVHLSLHSRMMQYHEMELLVVNIILHFFNICGLTSLVLPIPKVVDWTHLFF